MLSNSLLDRLSLLPSSYPPVTLLAVNELLAACNAYVDNIVSENHQSRSTVLYSKHKLRAAPLSDGSQ